MEVLLVLWIATALLGMAVAPEGKKGLGFILGLCFSILGVLIAAVMSPKRC